MAEVLKMTGELAFFMATTGLLWLSLKENLKNPIESLKTAHNNK